MQALKKSLKFALVIFPLPIGILILWGAILMNQEVHAETFRTVLTLLLGAGMAIVGILALITENDLSKLEVIGTAIMALGAGLLGWLLLLTGGLKEVYIPKWGLFDNETRLVISLSGLGIYILGLALDLSGYFNIFSRLNKETTATE